MEFSSSASPFRHQKSPSSGRFLGIYSEPAAMGPANGVELHEDDVFWSDASSDTGPSYGRVDSLLPPPPSPSANGPTRFRRPHNFGILAALPETVLQREEQHNGPFLHRAIGSSPTSSRMIPSIPKPQPPAPVGKFHQSAPVNVPVMPMAARRGDSDAFEEDEDGEVDDEMLPPHEIVARGSARSLMTTFSVLEGKGRTLKGRDLRRVRNAVFQQTGMTFVITG